ncbi:TLDc domain-containing protein [Chloropicon primus]|nr:TLDc domain-containing protein [Chloropicon primus]
MRSSRPVTASSSWMERRGGGKNARGVGWRRRHPFVVLGPARGGGESGDFVTDLVGKIFGKEVLADPEPFGLKRMTKEEWPDQWPATTTEWAEPLESDDTPELLKVRPLLKQTQMEKLKLGLAYDANVHGWGSGPFHTQLDGQGAGLLVATSTDGRVFGGYNPRGWLGYGEWRDAISAFLFVYDGSGKPIKSAKVGGSGMAIIDEPSKGPQWGPDGLKINLEAKEARSRLGTYYERTTLGKTLFKGSDPSTPVRLKDLRVYVAVEETELAKNYKPNAFQWQEGELEELRKNDDKDVDGEEPGLFDKLFGRK